MFIKLTQKLCITLLLLMVSWRALAALELSDPVPIGPRVTVGKLPNGLTYYLQKNNQPAKRLELRLVVKAGSVLEDDDQQGLAHFTEHMAFNGSTHFKKHELISYLQSIGLKFGADLNAYTSFNETVYILPIPTDKPEDVEKGFLVLEDWAQGLSLNDADIDQERAIVLEELRLGKGAQDRMNKVLWPKIFGGSLYAKRLPIGKEDILQNFKFDAIKRFYKDWYRPDLMAVVAVGDLDTTDMQALVEKHFGKLTNPAQERARTYPTIPMRDHTEAVVVTDKEATNNVMQIHYPVKPVPVVVTFADYRKKLIEMLFGAMLGQRMQELTQQSSPPFVGGGSGIGTLAPGYQVLMSVAVLGRLGVDAASQALVSENERARQFGFTEVELERARKNAMRMVEQGFAEREKTDSARYAAEYLRHFLIQEDIPGIENELAYFRALLPGIDLGDVNAFATTVFPEKAAKLVVYTGSDKAEEKPPAPKELLKSLQEAEQHPVVARDEKAVASSFMAQAPQAGSVVSEHTNEALGLTELALSNGLKVILKPTDFQSDQILVSASRFGGQSRFDQADMFNAGYTSEIVDAMGLAGFTPLEVQNMLAGKVVSLQMGLHPLTEEVNGSASQADLETLLQLIHLKFGPGRRDADLFQSLVSRSQDAVKNATAQPESVFADAQQTTLFGAHPRLWLTPRPEHFTQLNLDRILSIYKERFSSARGLTFVIVGSFTLEGIRPLIKTYLASLPTPELPLAYVDLGVRPVKGVVKKEVLAGTEPKSQVSISFTGSATYSEDEQLRLAALVDVLNIKIMDVLREKLTLIYGGGISGGLVRVPYPHYQLQLSLPCAPENVDKVIAAAFGEIQKIQDAGPEVADLEKVKRNWLLAHRTRLRENNFWLSNLQSSDLYGTDPNLILDYEKRVASVTVEDIQAMARNYLLNNNYVQVVLRPEK
jgi:zinc protease